MYALIKSNKFVRWINLKKDYPNISFPKIISEGDLPEGVVSVSMNNPPVVDSFEIAEKQEQPIFENSLWKLHYDVREMTDDEIQQYKNNKAEEVRNERNQRLLISDWTQTVDSPVNRTAWAEYRQSLRDITEQEGFPLTVIWPEEPQ